MDGRLERTVPFKFSLDDATIGYDTGTPLIGDYHLPFAFTGKLEKVTFDLGPMLSPVEQGWRPRMISSRGSRRFI